MHKEYPDGALIKVKELNVELVHIARESSTILDVIQLLVARETCVFPTS